MAVQSPDPVRTPPRRRRHSTRVDVAPPATAPQPESAAPAVAPASGSGAREWGGTAVLVVPAAGLLGIVAAVVVVNEVNQWWTLVFAMVFVVIATLCVVATIARMLGGEED